MYGVVQNYTNMTKCVKCNNEIHPLRLKVLPNTKVCVNCSSAKPKQGVTIQRGEGDHTYEETILLD